MGVEPLPSYPRAARLTPTSNGRPRVKPPGYRSRLYFALVAVSRHTVFRYRSVGLRVRASALRMVMDFEVTREIVSSPACLHHTLALNPNPNGKMKVLIVQKSFETIHVLRNDAQLSNLCVRQRDVVGSYHHSLREFLQSQPLRMSS